VKFSGIKECQARYIHMRAGSHYLGLLRFFFFGFLIFLKNHIIVDIWNF